ncbi:LysR substrate-binding domain-containing protein [Pseudomonas sp. NFR16]|uniref:LysR substrate-binding domain-containing protein n=1 Tax=Pseudomonas sp. NFR16 TaxID=1566248 RepID=UPI0008C142C5|nr:LysR substrate-binding domain-containing protein [Pseudomonas sp. NFR16]SEI43368.1 DNA-binding transcriptional regulator, LysR family [Pseudomonas sp. NFR16]
MRRPLPPLDLLIGFEAAARQLSFSKAGDEVFVTQSAISRQVKKLEDFLGIALFERRHRSLELTQAGRELFDVVNVTLAQLTQTVDGLRKDPAQLSVKISTTTSFASLWLVPRLAHFRDMHPEIAIHLEADNRIIDLKQGVADLAIRYCAPDQIDPTTDVRLAVEKVFPVCSPSLLRREGRALECIQDLSRHTLLHLSDSQNAWPWLQWGHWLTACHAVAPVHQVGLRFSHFDQMMNAATMGHGVALGSSPLVNHLLETGSLVAPLGIGVESPRAFYICRGPGHNEAVEVFIQWLLTSMTSPLSESPTPVEGLPYRIGASLQISSMAI